MSRTIATLIFVASTALASSALAQATAVSGAGEWFQLDEIGLQTPPGWTRHDDATSVLTIVLPAPLPGHEFRDNVRVMKYPLKGTSDLDSLLMAQVQSVGEAFELLGSGVNPGQPRIAWLATSQNQPAPGRAPLAKVDYMMVHGDHMFVLHAICEASLLETSRPTFDAIARSVKFANAAPTAAATTPPTYYAPPPPAPVGTGPQRSQAFEQGRVVGFVTAIAMAAVVLAFGAFFVVKSLLRR
jgi:hypothetical protein